MKTPISDFIWNGLNLLVKFREIQLKKKFKYVFSQTTEFSLIFSELAKKLARPQLTGF